VQNFPEIDHNEYLKNPVVNELMEATNDGFWDWNIKTGDVYFSRRWKEMLGYNETDIEPHVRSWERIVHPDDMAHVTSVLNAHLNGETSFYQTEHRVKMKNGQWKWILDRGRVIERDKDGTPLRAAGAHIDITEKKLLEETLEQRKVFLSIASHELKTPLTSLFIISDAILKVFYDKKNDKREERLESLLKKNESQIKRLNRLIEEMLDVTRIESGKMTLRPEWFLISDLIKAIDDQFSAQVLETTNKPLELIYNKNFKVFWDKIRIEQVIGNLITNSIKYGEGSKIKLEINEVNEIINLIISDEGPGIDKKYHEKIFRCFERANHQSGIKGLGLGLFISKEIIELHKGKIAIESESKKGAKFFINLPKVLN